MRSNITVCFLFSLLLLAFTPYMDLPEGMVKIPAGQHTLFYSNPDEKQVAVESFYLDIRAVSNADFLEFVTANPEWRRSSVPKLFADTGYLKHWKDDLQPGDERILQSPVTNVSWFAANAYCKWKGKRLPTLTEWEYAAAKSPRNNDRTIEEIILEWYSKPTPDALPPAGSIYKNQWGLYDMHGAVWEWVYDFNSVVMGNDSRSNSAIRRELFCASASFGAANREDYASFIRFAFRGSLKASYTIGNLGFRCAK